MNFDQLRIFISVAEHGSFTKAAETMYISHSTTSRNVAALEESLGVKLLMRDSRSMRLTAAGEMLFHEGKLLLQNAEELEKAVKDAGGEFSGRLTVASVNLFSEILTSKYKEFCKQYPYIEFGIYHRELSEIASQVLCGEADLGVSFSYVLPENMEGFELKRISSEKFCVIVSSDNPLSKKESVTSADLFNENYVSVGEQRSEFTKRIENLVLKGKSKSEIISVPTLETLFLQVNSGNGLSIVPYPMAREFNTNCSLLDLQDIDTDFDVVVFWRKNNDNAALLLFTDLLFV